MIGGFLKGMVAGTAVAGLIAGAASVLSDGPAVGPADAPQVAPVEVTPGSGFDTRREDRAATLPDAESRPGAGDPPQMTPPAPEDPADPVPRADPATAPATAPTADGADILGAVPAPGTDSGGIAAPRDSPVSSRLPASMPDAPPTDQPAIAQLDEAATDAPALRRNAEAFANPRGRPMLAVVLMEVAGSTVTFERLESFPYPLSIALDPGRAGAAEAAARYREAGFEVLLRIDLPQDASPAETRAILQAAFDRVPQAVAVLEGAAGGLPVAGTAAILAQTGHGLVTRGPRPDTEGGVLARAGVATAPLQRDLDQQRRDVATIESGLDQAATAADAQRGVIVLGRMRADTLRALSLWSGQGGARQVRLAPVSAVLSAQRNP